LFYSIFLRLKQKVAPISTTAPSLANNNTTERKSNRWSTDSNQTNNSTTYKSNANLNLTHVTSPTKLNEQKSPTLTPANSNKLTVRGNQRWESTVPTQQSSVQSSNILG